jgi:hypothetical protein
MEADREASLRVHAVSHEWNREGTVGSLLKDVEEGFDDVERHREDDRRVLLAADFSEFC